MNSSVTDEVELKTQSDLELLPKDRTILEHRVTEFRPLGSLNVLRFLCSLAVTSPR